MKNKESIQSKVKNWNKYTFFPRHQEGWCETVPIYVRAETDKEAWIIAAKMLKKKSQSWFSKPKSEYEVTLIAVEKK